ncbi:uncharacterized protein [Diabrotica undecimpunctata]|uniref:uncharacterized protein n=1 Tax=Diabrotica undecimpunctata TaxID=50387 RepID=UPI003B634254
MKRLYSIARASNKASKDLTYVLQIKGADGRVLRTGVEIKQKSYEYLSKFLNEKHQRSDKACATPNKNVIPEITREEVIKTLNRSMNGKALGPDGIPVEVWKALGEKGIDILWQMVSKIHEEERIPNAWRESMMVSFYKDKGGIQDTIKG